MLLDSETNDESNQDETKKKEEASEWKTPPLQYHLETIGIGDVFLSSPPKETLYNSSIKEEGDHNKKGPDNDDDDATEQNISILSWEISGIIKSCPQDFIVREVGGLCCTKKDYANNKGDASNNIKVANLTDVTTLPKTEMNVDTKTIHTKRKEDVNNNDDDEKNSLFPSLKKVKIDIAEMKDTTNDNLVTSTSDTKLISSMQGHANDEKEESTIKSVSSPMEAIQFILSKCIKSSDIEINNGGEKIHDLLECVQKLQEEAFNDIIRLPTDNVDNSSSTLKEGGKNYVLVPPIAEDVKVVIYNSSTSNGDVISDKSNRGTLHRILRLQFPLLSSCTVKQNEIIDEMGHINKFPDSCVKITKDKTFQAIIPFLSHTRDDLVDLYTFYNRGCFMSKDSSTQRGCRRNKKNPKRHGDGNSDDDQSKTTTSSIQSQVVLRLKPELSKDKRREIHHLLAKACRDFETGTLANYKFEESGMTKAGSAIIVSWSQKAQIKAAKKQPKKCTSGNEANEMTKYPNTLCILKKTNQEHLSAINHLVAALRCRQSDIGLAGIKDMCAVTYQFCTLRNISPRRARKANEKLNRNSIELGNFGEVAWALQPGMLFGNQFEITLRDIKRVQIRRSKIKGIEERFVNCQPSHIDDMVANIQKNGFINYYGVQRVGDAGSDEEMGVRPFDIGRALLKQDYSNAIDLLMAGRSNEGEQTQRIRRIWRETGDPLATLAAFPQSNVMIRERTVLQGLKRYGKDNPLDALKCLSYSIRMFWIHAFQSYVWNQMATERLRLGAFPLVGDLYSSSENNNEVKVVTDPSCVALDEIVLPLPGYNIQYPTNVLGQIYKQFMENQGGIFRKEGEFSAKGGYRFLVAKAKCIEWHPIHEMKGDDGEAIVTTALFKFSLPSGSYATQGLLRELMTTQLARKNVYNK